MPAGRREDGAVLVEFAIVLPLFVALLVAISNFGLAMNAKINMTHVSALGARLAAVQSSGGDGMNLPDFVRSRADTTDLRKARVCISYPLNTATSPPGKGRVGDPVLVTYDQLAYSFLPIDINGNLGSKVSIPISGDATMRLERAASSTAELCSTP